MIPMIMCKRYVRDLSSADQNWKEDGTCTVMPITLHLSRQDKNLIVSSTVYNAVYHNGEYVYPVADDKTQVKLVEIAEVM